MLALFAGSAVAAPQDHHVPARRVVVAGAAAETRPRSRRRTPSRRRPAQLRVVQTNADQLGVTHLLAARGYDTVVTVGVDRRIAIAPVAEQYPRVRFVAAKANGLGAAMSGAWRA